MVARIGTLAVGARDRFMEKVEPEPNTGCWLWSGNVVNGYGRCRWGGRTRIAHRVSYERFIGPIPAGYELDHLCRARACVNPRHLRPVTREQNITAPGSLHHAMATHCRHGHEFTTENTYRPARGGRVCRACDTKSARRNRRRRNA